MEDITVGKLIDSHLNIQSSRRWFRAKKWVCEKKVFQISEKIEFENFTNYTWIWAWIWTEKTEKNN